jgi:CheY-like chemotaxis protein
MSWILLIDDDEDMRESMSAVLELNGYKVKTAAHGRAALEVLRATPERPALILLDLMMPVMDGWQFRDEQLRDPALAAIPVVVVSGQGLLMRQPAMPGVADVLRKPFDIVDLLRSISANARPALHG